MYLPKDESPKFDPAPAGTHPARCVRFVDLGTQEQTYLGETKMKRMVTLSFELPNELRDDGKPFLIGKRYAFSMHEKSTLRKHLEAWRGKKFDDADLGHGGFDIQNIIGKACVLTVVHSERDGNTYANIDGIGAAMRGLEYPDQINPSVYIALVEDRFDMEAYDGLTDRMKDQIAKSPEFSDIVGSPANSSYSDESAPQSQDDQGVDDMDDEIPF